MITEEECKECSMKKMKKQIVCDICRRQFEKMSGDVTVIEEAERKDYCSECIKKNNIKFEGKKNIIRWDF